MCFIIYCTTAYSYYYVMPHQARHGKREYAMRKKKKKKSEIVCKCVPVVRAFCVYPFRGSPNGRRKGTVYIDNT